MSPRSASEELIAAGEAARRIVAGRVPELAAAPLVAIGWATVDLDRAATQVDAALGGPGGWEPRERDSLLGATVRIRTTSAGGPALLLLEPETEGRLAAALARHGEGIAAIYLIAPQASSQQPPRVREPVAASRHAGGPLGPERLVLGGRDDGPSVLLVDPGSVDLPRSTHSSGSVPAT